MRELGAGSGGYERMLLGNVGNVDQKAGVDLILGMASFYVVGKHVR